MVRCSANPDLAVIIGAAELGTTNLLDLDNLLIRAEQDGTKLTLNERPRDDVSKLQLQFDFRGLTTAKRKAQEQSTAMRQTVMLRTEPKAAAANTLLEAKLTEKTVPPPTNNYPGYDGALGAMPGSFDDSVERAARFNDFVSSNEGNTVFLSVYLDDRMIEQFSGSLSKSKNPWFTVMDDRENGVGWSHRIYLPEDLEREFTFNETTGRLQGYFKVWGISGPNQGCMSLNLRPVR